MVSGQWTMGARRNSSVCFPRQSLFFLDDPGLVRDVIKIAEKLKGFFIPDNAHFREQAGEGLEGSGMVRFDVVDDEIIDLAAVRKQRLKFSGIRRKILS
jgi:hypothetical protein